MKKILLNMIIIMMILVILTSCKTKTESMDEVEGKAILLSTTEKNSQHTTDKVFEYNEMTFQYGEDILLDYYVIDGYQINCFIKYEEGYILAGTRGNRLFMARLDDSLEATWYNELPNKLDANFFDLMVTEDKDVIFVGRIQDGHENVLDNAELFVDNAYVAFVGKITAEGYYDWIIGTEDSIHGAISNIYPLTKDIAVLPDMGSKSSLQYIDYQLGKCVGKMELDNSVLTRTFELDNEMIIDNGQEYWVVEKVNEIKDLSRNAFSKKVKKFIKNEELRSESTTTFSSGEDVLYINVLDKMNVVKLTDNNSRADLFGFSKKGVGTFSVRHEGESYDGFGFITGYDTYLPYIVDSK